MLSLTRSRMARLATGKAPSALEMFTQVQLGMHPPLAAQRAFLNENFAIELQSKGIHEAKLAAMDGRTCLRYLRQFLYQRYLGVPLRLFTFDMEFTESPRFTAEGPTAEITEIGLYSPARDARISILVKPSRGTLIPQAITDLTGITNEMIAKEGIPFPQAWEKVLEFVGTPEPNEPEHSAERILLLSHGGKLADVSMLQWALKEHSLVMPQSFVFGDTFHIIRDAHRKRPVTPDRHPPSWRLADLVGWLKVETSEKAHRAGDDARMTWDALHHTLDRYGEESLSPRQQLVIRFFFENAKERIRMFNSGKGGAPGSDPNTDLEAISSLDLDSVFSSASQPTLTSTSHDVNVAGRETSMPKLSQKGTRGQKKKIRSGDDDVVNFGSRKTKAPKSKPMDAAAKGNMFNSYVMPLKIPQSQQLMADVPDI